MSFRRLSEGFQRRSKTFHGVSGVYEGLIPGGFKGIHRLSGEFWQILCEFQRHFIVLLGVVFDWFSGFFMGIHRLSFELQCVSGSFRGGSEGIHRGSRKLSGEVQGGHHGVSVAFQRHSADFRGDPGSFKGAHVRRASRKLQGVSETFQGILGGFQRGFQGFYGESKVSDDINFRGFKSCFREFLERLQRSSRGLYGAPGYQLQGYFTRVPQAFQDMSGHFRGFMKFYGTSEAFW